MSIKLIAVDMDGTFLDDEKRYDRGRFLAQYRQMKARGIRFAVASGNQYWQLISFFPEIASEIAFVAENGGWVRDAGEDVFNADLSRDHFARVVALLHTLPDVDIIACGKRSAYTLRNYTPALKAMAARYYHRLELVDDFSNLDDTFLKFGLNLPDSLVPEMRQLLRERLDGMVTAVTTGHGNIDLIIPGIHKANGLRLLQARWGINDDEVAAFGDSGNDLEMLRQAGFGFAMANASPEAKAAARYRAPDNNQQGVLQVIDRILNSEPPFA